MDIDMVINTPLEVVLVSLLFILLFWWMIAVTKSCKRDEEMCRRSAESSQDAPQAPMLKIAS